MLLGPLHGGPFASWLNKKCDRFNARWYCRGAEAVDAFTQDWQGENNWINAPFAVLDRVFTLMRAQRAHGAVLVPSSRRYSSRPWHTAIFGPRWPPWLLERVPLERGCLSFQRGKRTGARAADTRVSCCRVDFRRA